MLNLPAFFQLWAERKSRSAMVVKINKMLSEAGRNFTFTLDTLALSRDLAMACEMLIKTSSWQTDLAWNGQCLKAAQKGKRTPHLTCCFYLVILCRGTVRRIPGLKSSTHLWYFNWFRLLPWERALTYNPGATRPSIFAQFSGFGCFFLEWSWLFPLTLFVFCRQRSMQMWSSPEELTIWVRGSWVPRFPWGGTFGVGRRAGGTLLPWVPAPEEGVFAGGEGAAQPDRKDQLLTLWRAGKVTRWDLTSLQPAGRVSFNGSLKPELNRAGCPTFLR